MASSRKAAKNHSLKINTHAPSDPFSQFLLRPSLSLDTSKRKKEYIQLDESVFIGSARIASDWEFVKEHQITHVVNCISQNSSNVFENLGIQYLPLQMKDSTEQNLEDNILQALKFIS